MRTALILTSVWLAAVGIAAAQGYSGNNSGLSATHSRGGQAGQSGSSNGASSSQSGSGHGPPPPPPPPPIPRCADLAVTSLGFASAVPGGAPLATDEVALEYDVHNAGTAMYVAPSGASQALSLEYSTPGGVHQVGSIPLPQPAAGATAASAPQGVTLAQGASWRGFMRVTLPAQARRWPLRLRLSFAQSSSPYAPRISDCDPENDEAPVPRP